MGWANDHQIIKDYTDFIIPLAGEVDGCTSAIIKVRLLLAENSKTRIDGVSGERVDFEKQLRELKAKRDTEQAAQDQAELEAAESAAKKADAETARQKRLSVERKKREAADRGRLDKLRAEEAAKTAEEQAKIRAACKVIYDKTADKKVGDLTVREAQQVQSCQVLGLYPAR